MTHNLQFMWRLLFLWLTNSVTSRQSKTQSTFTSLAGACKHNLVTAWFLLLPPFLLAVSPSWQREKVGRERGGHGPEIALKPQPLFKWGCLLVHYSAFPSSCRRKRGMWKCILVCFLTHFFPPPPPWPNSLRENISLACTKNLTSRYFSYLILLLFGPRYFSLYLSHPLSVTIALLHFFYCHLHVSALLAPNTISTSPLFLFDWDTLGFCFKYCHFWFICLKK